MAYWSVKNETRQRRDNGEAVPYGCKTRIREGAEKRFRGARFVGQLGQSRTIGTNVAHVVCFCEKRQNHGLNPRRRDLTPRQAGRNGGAESRKVFQEPPDSIISFPVHRSLGVGGCGKNILRGFESPWLRVMRKQLSL